jgi:hypothetical protein
VRIKVALPAGLHSAWSVEGARSLVGQTTMVEGSPALILDAQVMADPALVEVTLEGEFPWAYDGAEVDA